MSVALPAALQLAKPVGLLGGGAGGVDPGGPGDHEP